MISPGNRRGPSETGGPKVGKTTGPAGAPTLGMQRDAAIDARVSTDVDADIDIDLLLTAEETFDDFPDEDADWMFDDAPEEASARDDDGYDDDDLADW